MLKSMEDTHSRESMEVKEIAEKCVKAQYQTAFDYRIYHDVLIWERDIYGRSLWRRRSLCSVPLASRSNPQRANTQGA